MAKQAVMHPLKHDDYLAIVTILDSGVQVSEVLSSIEVVPQNDKKLLVDLALKSGIDAHRFCSFDMDEHGHVLRDSHAQVSYGALIAGESLLDEANRILSQEPQSVRNSVLTESQKNMVLADAAVASADETNKFLLYDLEQGGFVGQFLQCETDHDLQKAAIFSINSLLTANGYDPDDGNKYIDGDCNG